MISPKDLQHILHMQIKRNKQPTMCYIYHLFYHHRSRTISDCPSVRLRDISARVEVPLAPYAEYIQQIVTHESFTTNSSISGIELVKGHG